MKDDEGLSVMPSEASLGDMLEGVVKTLVGIRQGRGG